MSDARHRRGQEGEQLALDYLRSRGYRIAHQNYRCRSGEIDIIAWDGSTLVFVEVKTRRHHGFGAPQAVVDGRKQRTLVKVAMTYVQRHRLENTALRFDVVAITWPAGAAAEVMHIPSAFSPSGPFFY